MMHSGILLIGLLVSASIVGPFFYYFGRGDDLANHLRGSQNVVNVNRRLLPRDVEGDRTGQVQEGVKTSGWWQDATGLKFWQEGPAALGWQAWKAHGVLGLWWGRSNTTDAETAFVVIVAAVGDDVPAELDNEGAEASLGFGLGVDDASSGWESVLLAQDDGQAVGDLSHEHSDDEADPLPDDEVETERLKSEYDAYYSQDQDQYEDDYYSRSSSSPSAPARLYDDASTPVKDDNGAEAWEARN